MKQKIVFFGSGYYTIPIVEKLRSHGLIFVATTEPQSEKTKSNNTLTRYLKNENIPFMRSSMSKTRDIDKIKDLKPTLGVLASFGAFIPNKVIDIFPLGILNIHPSLLPKHKGPSPIQGTILAGEKKTGTTVIKLDDQIDHGPILSQEEIELSGRETLESLTEKLFSLGGDMIIKIIRMIETGSYPEEKVQRNNSDNFTQKLTKQDGFVDINNPPPAEQLDRMIRAYFPWPGVWFRAKLNNVERIIKLFPEQKIQVEGKNVMKLSDFANGYPEGEQILSRLSLS